MGRKEKLSLITNGNPGLKDLYDDLLERIPGKPE